MESKYFLKSKRFWGLVVSSVGFLVMVFGAYFGKDLSGYVQATGALLQVFGLPFTFYGSATANQPLGFRK